VGASGSGVLAGTGWHQGKTKEPLDHSKELTLIGSFLLRILTIVTMKNKLFLELFHGIILFMNRIISPLTFNLHDNSKK
jgi:hypothetical protein